MDICHGSVGCLGGCRPQIGQTDRDEVIFAGDGAVKEAHGPVVIATEYGEAPATISVGAESPAVNAAAIMKYVGQIILTNRVHVESITKGDFHF
jgi:hypothetical protein